MTAFSAGTVLGPALGGVLAGNLGIPATFGCVGVLFGVNAIATRLLTHETMPALAAKGSELDGSTNRLLDDQSTPPSTVLGSVYATLGQWRPLLMHRELRPLLLLNGAYWVALPGPIPPTTRTCATHSLGSSSPSLCPECLDHAHPSSPGVSCRRKYDSSSACPCLRPLCPQPGGGGHVLCSAVSHFRHGGSAVCLACGPCWAR